MGGKDVDGWYLSSVKFFRAMGFFVRYENLSDEDLSCLIKSIVVQDWDMPFPALAMEDAQAADMFFLTADRARVWYGDLERIYRGANAYAGTLQEWSVISRGTFAPEAITETWEGDAGPVVVEFTAGGKRYRFVHKGGDMIDMAIVSLINRIIAPSGSAFAVCDNLGMPSFILVLTQPEKARLIAERKWHFV
jgi:hypothetical protein